jgi:hypothetical protein
VFPGNHIKLFNGVLAQAKLKFDRDGKKPYGLLEHIIRNDGVWG